MEQAGFNPLHCRRILDQEMGGSNPRTSMIRSGMVEE
jgi:hypothetical protein